MKMNQQNLLSLQMECTFYFEQNPYAFETVDSIAVRLGRDSEKLKSVLQQLEGLSIIDRKGEGEQAVYHYRLPDVRSEVILE